MTQASFSGAFDRINSAADEERLKKGEQAAVVESVKAASEVYAPVSGEVVEVNSELEGAPALVNEDSAGKGWFVKLRVADQGELASLMDEAAYAEYLKTLD